MTIKIKKLSYFYLIINIRNIIKISNDFPNNYWTKKHYFKKMPLKFKYSRIILVNNKLAGYAIVSKKDSMHVHRFIVSKKFRNQGIGSLLQFAIENVAKKYDEKYITLYVSESNLSAINFYKSHNYIYMNNITDTILNTTNFLMKKIIS